MSETKNFIIRGWRETDAEDLRQYALYKNGTGFEAWEKWPVEIDECKKCAAFFAGNKNGWAVERKADSRVVGFVSFNEVKDRLLDFGHGFTHPLIGDAAAKAEALEAMVQHAFDTLDIDAVDARNEKAWTDNTAPLLVLGFAELEDKMQMTRERWALRKTRGAETLAMRLDDDFSIVECPEKHVVGVRVACPPLSRLDSIDVVRRAILEGTCELLEKRVGNKNPGQCIAVMCDIRTGADFTYIIGVEVEAGTVLPEGLPPDAVAFTLPAATFAKRVKKADESANNALSSFSYSNFRKDMNYVFSDASFPFSLYDRNAEMVLTYQPVKQPQTEAEKYDSVSYEIVTLPDIKIIAKSGPGMDCMWNFFKEKEKAEQTQSARLHVGNFVAFGGRNTDGKQSAYFGTRVTRFENTPEGFEEAVYPSRLFVRMFQKQTNNDNPSIIYDGARDWFFKNHPEYVYDPKDEFYDLFIFQYEQGVEVFAPVRRVTQPENGK